MRSCNLLYCGAPYRKWKYSQNSSKTNYYRKVHSNEARRTIGQEVLHLWGAGAKRKGANHSRFFPMAQLMLGVDRKRCEQFRIVQVEKRARSAWKIKVFPELRPFIEQRHHMGRSLESPAIFAVSPSWGTLPVEIGLPPVDTRGEHVFAIFGRKEWIYKKSFLIFIKNSWQTVLQRAETSDNHRMSPTRPEINAKSFVFWHVFRSSRWYLLIWVMSLHVEAPFVMNFWWKSKNFFF